MTLPNLTRTLDRAESAERHCAELTEALEAALARIGDAKFALATVHTLSAEVTDLQGLRLNMAAIRIAAKNGYEALNRKK